MAVNPVDYLLPTGTRRLDKQITLISQGLDPTNPHRSTVYSKFRIRLKRIRRKK